MIALNKDNASADLRLAAWPQVDFSTFGEIEAQPISRIQKLVGSFLSRNKHAFAVIKLRFGFTKVR